MDLFLFKNFNLNAVDVLFSGGVFGSKYLNRSVTFLVLHKTIKERFGFRNRK